MNPASRLLLNSSCTALLCCLFFVRQAAPLCRSCLKLMVDWKVGFILLVGLLSCTNKRPQPVDIKIAKTVPQNYKPTTDNYFSNHQDTLYYMQQYFTGFRYALFANGDTELVQSYFNGLEEGPQRKWYGNKQLAEEHFFINGKKEGLQQGWWADAKQKFIYHFSNDLFTDELKEWNAAGQLNRDFHYMNGQEEGSQKMWWDNGTIRANYVIRDGKKYGLIGLKICNNPYDSVTKK